VADDWRFGGSWILDDAEPGHRRETVNIMLSMPRGTDPSSVQFAARELAKIAAFIHEMAPAGPTALPRTQTQATPAPRPIDIEPRR
jgi:hypothetical protein